MLIGERGQLLLVRAPAHFGGRGALLAEALHAPGVDELVHLFRPVGDLRIPLAAVDHLHAQFVGEVVEGPALRVLGDPLRLLTGKLLLLEACGGDVEQRVLREVADESWVGTVLENGRRAGRGPAGDLLPEVHVPPVEREVRGVGPLRMLVGVPEFDRRVEVEHAVVVAPLHDLAAVDVPGEVDEQVARGEVLAEQVAEVVRRHLVLDERDALLDPRPQRRLIGLEVDDRDAARIDLDVIEEHRERAAGDGTEADEENAFVEGDHREAVYSWDRDGLTGRGIGNGSRAPV